MRPQSIINFERLYLGSLALGILNYFLSYDEMMAQLQADPAVAEMGFASSGFILGTAAVGWGISLLFWFFIARRASNIAKWVLVIITALGLLFLPSSLSTVGAVTLVFTLIITVVQLAAIALLFRADAKRWLEGKGNVADDVNTFE